LLKSALASLKSRIDFAFVYGSVARGEDKATSDIDLMVIGAVSLDDVLDAVGPLEKQFRRPVNPTIYSREDLKKRLHEGNHFLQSLMDSKKVFLIGDENEYREAWPIQKPPKSAASNCIRSKSCWRNDSGGPSLADPR
jgi:predicted nucleotidyltransferase